MLRLGLSLLLVGAALLMGGCSTEAPKPTDTARVSTIPWNKPEPGEGQGMMGGMMNTR